MVWTSIIESLFSMPCGSLQGICNSLKEQVGKDGILLEQIIIMVTDFM